MPLFTYKGKMADGTATEGSKESSDKFALYHDLRTEGITVVSVEEASAKTPFSISGFLASISGVPIHDKVIFARNLSAMLDAGLPLSRALVVMERQTKQKKLKDITIELNNTVKQGKTLSEALGKFPDTFSDLFVSMVRAGEESGTLSKALKNIGNQMNSVYTLQKKVKGALMYPAVIILLMLIIGVLMLVFVVPTLTATFKDMDIELPWTTKLIIFISDFLKNHTILFLAGVGVVIASLIAAYRMKQTHHMIDYLVLRIPVIGTLVKETNAARTARTLSSLLAAGVEIVLSMEITERVVQNDFFRVVLLKAKDMIKKGDPIASVFEQNDNLYPPLVGEMISIGEETGKLGEMLGNVAEFYESEVDQKTKDLSSIIEPFLMIFIGIAVGFFAIAMMMPTLSLVNQM
jgi:type IV pilus assembly protein PilC